MWYIDPEKIYLDNESKQKSGWRNRYFNYKRATSECNLAIVSVRLLSLGHPEIYFFPLFTYHYCLNERIQYDYFIIIRSLFTHFVHPLVLLQE